MKTITTAESWKCLFNSYNSRFSVFSSADALNIPNNEILINASLIVKLNISIESTHPNRCSIRYETSNVRAMIVEKYVQE